MSSSTDVQGDEGLTEQDVDSFSRDPSPSSSDDFRESLATDRRRFGVSIKRTVSSARVRVGGFFRGTLLVMSCSCRKPKE